MNALDLLETIEAEMQSHRDALTRLGRVRADILRQMASTSTPIIPPVDSKVSEAIITTKQQNGHAALM